MYISLHALLCQYIYVYSGIHCMQITEEYGDGRIRFSYKRELHSYEVNIYREHIRSVSCQFTICVIMLMIFCFFYNIPHLPSLCRSLFLAELQSWHTVDCVLKDVVLEVASPRWTRSHDVTAFATPRFSHASTWPTPCAFHDGVSRQRTRALTFLTFGEIEHTP